MKSNGSQNTINNSCQFICLCDDVICLITGGMCIGRKKTSATVGKIQQGSRYTTSVVEVRSSRDFFIPVISDFIEINFSSSAFVF